MLGALLAIALQGAEASEYALIAQLISKVQLATTPEQFAAAVPKGTKIESAISRGTVDVRTLGAFTRSCSIENIEDAADGSIKANLLCRVKKLAYNRVEGGAQLYESRQMHFLFGRGGLNRVVLGEYRSPAVSVPDPRRGQ